VIRLVLTGLACAGCYQPPQTLLPLAAPAPALRDGPPQSCEQAVGATLERRRRYVAARLGLAQAELARDEGTASLEIRLRDDANSPGGSRRVGVRWGLPALGTSGARRSAARAQRRLTESDEVLVDAELAARVRRDFLAARSARAALTLAQRRLAHTHARLRAAERRLSAGTTTAVRRTRAELAHAAAKAAVAGAEAQLEGALARAAAWTGTRPDDTPCDPELSPTTADAHPAVIAARAEANRSHARGYARTREAWPWPFLQLAWDQRIGAPDRLLFYVGAPIPLPGDSPADVESARVHARIADAQEVRDRVIRGVARARAALEAATDELSAIDGESAQLDAARSVAQRAEAASAAADEALELREALLEWEARRQDAVAAVEGARIELRRQQGRP